MAAPAERLAIVGLGLIGGSVAARVVAAWPSAHVVGVDAPSVCEAALEKRWIHEARTRVEELEDVEFIVLATPIEIIQKALTRLGALRSAPTITDVGSTKRAIMASAAAAGLAAFVGGHPMTGAETAGVSNARSDLFDGRTWALVPGTGVEEDRVQRVEFFVRALGAVPYRVGAEVHDEVVAYVSHLPQLIAVALMKTVGEKCGSDGLRLAGRTLSEMTRVAASPAGLWQGILLSNADRVAEACREFASRLPSGDTALTDGQTVAEAFATAREWRARLDRGQGM